MHRLDREIEANPEKGLGDFANSLWNETIEKAKAETTRPENPNKGDWIGYIAPFRRAMDNLRVYVSSIKTVKEHDFDMRKVIS